MVFFNIFYSHEANLYWSLFLCLTDFLSFAFMNVIIPDFFIFILMPVMPLK